MITHLYKNFLESETAYIQNVEYWKRIIFTLLSTEKIEFEDYLTITKKDGSLYLDGNPIFHFKIKNSNKAVRIIQEEAQETNVEFSAWLDTLELTNGDRIEELVIGLALSNESVLLSIETINAWIVNDFPKPKMKNFLNKIISLQETIFSDKQETVYA